MYLPTYRAPHDTTFQGACTSSRPHHHVHAHMPYTDACIHTNAHTHRRMHARKHMRTHACAMVHAHTCMPSSQPQQWCLPAHLPLPPHPLPLSGAVAALLPRAVPGGSAFCCPLCLHPHLAASKSLSARQQPRLLLQQWRLVPCTRDLQR